MKKILSIILAILMIVTTVPIAFAAEENVIDLSTLTGTYVISDSGEYTFTGSGNYGIKVESANPTIILNNASITVGEGSAIDIPSGSNTTIFVMGDNTIDTTNMWASVGGIFVAEGGTVNITSNSKANILRAHGSYSAAIGGKYDYPYESYNAGSISISNVTVYAYANNFHAAAIGAAGESTCGTINITNAVVYAYGAGDKWTSAPGIGSAWGHGGWPETIPVVIISDSEIHTFRYNSYSDYIGYLGDELGEEGGFHATGSINCGEGGSITNSTIYCYTGLDSTTTDKTVKYGTLGGLLKEDGTCESDCEGGSATCSVQAVCENCGTSYGEFDANKHTLVQKDAKAPTCTEIGWDAYEYCTACDYSTYVELPAITHIDANCDYKCDYNCGYVYETLDFSDAKVLTTNEKGILCIDGVQVKYDTYTVTSTYFMYNQYLPSGKYKLSGDVTVHKNGFIYIKEGENVSVDLNGYTWNCNDCTYTDGTFSVYDTSKDEKGKITSPYYGQILIRGDGEFNLYSGTIENSKGGGVLRVVEGTANLYGGKLKSNEYIIEHLLYENAKINLGGTVLENEEGYPEIISFIASSEVPQGVINVADYTGESLTVEIDADYAGTIKILEGVENAQEAEKYTIKFYKNDFYYLDKTEYNEETGEMFAYTAKYAFTQQPSAENGYTVDFNNSDATFQWYEVEETILTPDNVTAIDEVIFENEKWLHGGWYVELFTVDVEAGDMITVSTTSARSFDLNVHTEDYSIEEYVKATGKASVTIDSDAEVIVGIDVDVPNETTEFEIELIRTSEMDETETDKTLQNPECGKTYVCKTSVGETVYLSDVVTVGHNIVSVDAKAPTCTEIGWDAYEYCTKCNYTTYKELPASHNIVTVDAEAPTCTEIGWEDYEYCTRCNYTTYEEIPVDPEGHVLRFVTYKAPTCTEVGWEDYEYCTKCDYTTYKEIPVSHNIVTVDAKTPTCTEAGWDAYEYCTACTYTTYVEKEALKHSFTKYEITEEAKCGVSGKEVAYCDNGCGETDEKAIEALEHIFLDYIYNEDATCTADGTKTAECIYGCGETDTVTAEGTMLDHADADGDKLCDACQTEIAGESPTNQISIYISLVVDLIKLILSLVEMLGILA